MDNQLIISPVVKGKVIGRMRLNVVKPDSNDFCEAIGITEERRDELVHEMDLIGEKLAGQVVRTHEIFAELTAICNNLEEVEYCIIVHMKSMHSEGQTY
jgi:hypothetical protein